MALTGLLLLTLAISVPPTYQPHAPIIIQHQATSPDKPLVIEGYEISNPDGPGIQVRDVAYVIIRNNYLHDCGTKVSEQRQRLVRETGDARKAMLDKPFETGAILVFDAKGTVEISGNEVRNNDYGIMVQGHRFRAESASIFDNKVEVNHRAAFIWVGQADRVEVYDNFVKDNGLNAFYDNEGLVRAMQRGEDFGDGRTQGILAKDCSNLKIFKNSVINSVSDGIGIMNRGLLFDEDHHLKLDPDYEKHLVHNIEIFDNLIERNGEQGIWITSAKRGKVFRNKVIANAHRQGETGGSTGILLEGDVSEFEIFDNEIAWNDIFGIGIMCSSDNTIRGNDIHHNGDGGIGWSEQGYIEKRPSSNNVIEGNKIHDNRVAAFVVWGNTLGKTVLKNNKVANNGGNPIHFEFYDDYDVRTHLEDWQFDGQPVVFRLAADEQMAMFESDMPPNVDRPSEERDDSGMIFLSVLFVAAGLLLTAISLPMVFRKVPPNAWCGFRVRATLETEEVWYPANEYAGKRLFWVGIGTVVSALAMFLLPISNVAVCASVVGGRQALAFKLDVMNEAQRCTAVEQAVKQFGKLTILVNNAGGGGPKTFDMPMSDFERAFQLNLFSVFRMSQLCAPHMKAAGGGAIINISSMAGQNKNKRMCSYGASKAAVDHLTRNMAFDLGPDNIRVNPIAPGAIRTAALATVVKPDVETAMLKHTPLGRLGEGSDIAAAAVYLASPASSWASGQVLTVSGGGVQELD